MGRRRFTAEFKRDAPCFRVQRNFSEFFEPTLILASRIGAEESSAAARFATLAPRQERELSA